APRQADAGGDSVRPAAARSLAARTVAEGNEAGAAGRRRVARQLRAVVAPPARREASATGAVRRLERGHADRATPRWIGLRSERFVAGMAGRRGSGLVRDLPVED